MTLYVSIRSLYNKPSLTKNGMQLNEEQHRTAKFNEKPNLGLIFLQFLFFDYSMRHLKGSNSPL